MWNELLTDFLFQFLKKLIRGDENAIINSGWFLFFFFFKYFIIKKMIKRNSSLWVCVVELKCIFVAWEKENGEVIPDVCKLL